jgi:hypothetical protein
MQLANFLKVPVIYFFEGFPTYENALASNEVAEDFNYSFLAKLFSSLSEMQKEKIFQVLKNTRTLERTG